MNRFLPGMIKVDVMLLLTAALLILLLSACATKTASSTQSTSAESVDIQNRGASETDLQKRASIRLQLAVNYFQEGKFAVALDELKEALRLDPNYGDAHGVLALVYMELGEKGLAEQSFQRAIQLKPNDSDLNNNYGWFLCQNGREAQSIAYFENAVKNPLYQQPYRPLQNAGLCKLKTGDKKTAEEYFARSFALNPAGYVSALNLAKLYYERNEVERARFYVSLVNKSNMLNAESLWLGIRVEHKLGNRLEEDSLSARLRREYPSARETELLTRGVYDD